MNRPQKVGIAVAAAAAVVIGGALVWWLLPREPTAQDASRTYLDALSGGDFATIDAMRAIRLDADAEILLAGAFAGATALISDPRVEGVAERDGEARVRASALLSGERLDVSFTLTAEDGAWLLTEHLGALEVRTAAGDGRAAGDALWVGDALAAAGTVWHLLPAEYPVRAAPLGLLTGEATAAVGTGATAQESIAVALAPEAAAAAQEQLETYARACTQPAASVPDRCGLRVPWAVDLADLQSITFRVERMPVVEFSPDGRSYAATGGIVTATATGTAREGGTASVTYRAEDWALRGAVSFAGNEMVLTAG